MNKRKIIVLTILVLIGLLLIPLIFNKKEQLPFNAPNLSEISYSEVFFTNETDELKLAGMLMVPKGEGPFPTVVVIQGSGPSFRDNGWYLSIVKHLQDNGIAVLIPDKRGCEKSEGEWIGASFDELANDALSAIAFLKDQDHFEPSYMGLVGMSQGGWIAPIAATRSKDVAFIASISGTSVSTDEQLLFEEIHNISGYTYPFIAKLIAPITANRIKKMAHFSALTGFDPIPVWKAVDAPVLFAFGEGDTNVPVDTSVERLKENGLNDFEINIYPDGGHGIMDRETNTVSYRCLNDISDFIKEIAN
jgi:dipeptidyl aminopeptidase/acylaminoacyl peptidase